MESLKNHIKKSLSKEMKMEEVIIKKVYHLSYDIIDSKDDKDYKKHLEHLLSIIELSNPAHYESVCKSTYIIQYTNSNVDLIQIIFDNLKHKSRYIITISQIHQNSDGTFECYSI